MTIGRTALVMQNPLHRGGQLLSPRGGGGRAGGVTRGPLRTSQGAAHGFPWAGPVHTQTRPRLPAMRGFPGLHIGCIWAAQQPTCVCVYAVYMVRYLPIVQINRTCCSTPSHPRRPTP